MSARSERIPRHRQSHHREITTSMSMIHVANLFKRYGLFEALKGVSFDVAEGESVGLLGENGAGKTTLMRILSCFMPPSSGTARVAGADVVFESDKVRRSIGYMPESVPLYGNMRIVEYLRFRARLKGLRGAEANRAADVAMGRVDVTGRRRSLIQTLSKGLRQRVGIADALVNDPALLILDEPTSGLDPGQRRDVRNLVESLRKRRTVLISTHILPEIEQTCDRVVVISGGALLANQSVEEMKNLGERDRFRVVGRGDVAAARGIVEATPDIKLLSAEAEPDAGFCVECEGIDRTTGRERVVAALVTAGLGVHVVDGSELSLEEAFVRLVATGKEDG